MRLLLILFLFLSFGLNAQSHKGFRWMGADFSLFSIDLRTGILTQETKMNQKLELGKIQDWENIKKELPSDFDINTFYQKNKLLVSIPGTGQLYHLDINHLTLKRLDQTFFRGYNFNANQFFRKDTLFSVGGEGFWQKHSIITFYNPKSLEWDLYPCKNENQYPSNFNFSGYSKKNDEFFTAYLEVDSTLANKDISFAVYSFKNRAWSIKGKLNKDLVEFAKSRYQSVWTGQYLILYKDMRPNHVMVVDPFDNVLYRSKGLDPHFFIAKSEISYKNGHLFSRGVIGLGSIDKLMVDSISIHNLVNDSNKIGKVYEAYTSKATLIASGLLGVLIIVFGIVFYRKRFYKNRNELNFSELEMIVVKEIINNPIDKKFTTLEINTLLQINTKSYDNQRQIRNRVISGINKNLHSFFDSKDFICRTANVEDKRMMDYFINPEIKKKDIEGLSKKLLES